MKCGNKGIFTQGHSGCSQSKKEVCTKLIEVPRQGVDNSVGTYFTAVRIASDEVIVAIVGNGWLARRRSGIHGGFSRLALNETTLVVFYRCGPAVENMAQKPRSHIKTWNEWSYVLSHNFGWLFTCLV